MQDLTSEPASLYPDSRLTPVPSGRRMVTILMPALNEEAYIEQAVCSILPDPAEGIDCELIVLDGGSSDGTRAIVQSMAARDPRIRLAHNSRRVQSAAVNLGAELADPRSSTLVRADCHARYPKGFVAGCVARLTELEAASVVVPMRSVGRTPIQRAIAAAQNSRVGNGGSAHRLGGRSGFVEHGHHAAFDRRVFALFGGYDQSFKYNEDAELDLRLTRADQRIFLDADRTIEYFPRSSFGALARQYYRFGWGRANTTFKHRVRPRLRQLAPVALLLGCLASLVLALLDSRALGFPIGYLASMTAWGMGLAAQHRSPSLVLSGPAAVVMHLCWASGFIHFSIATALGIGRGDRAGERQARGPAR